jgi:hypothetical protein
VKVPPTYTVLFGPGARLVTSLSTVGTKAVLSAPVVASKAARKLRVCGFASFWSAMVVKVPPMTTVFPTTATASTWPSST